MEILNFEGSKGSSNKRSKRFIAIASIVAMGFMGSTFAASITLNSANTYEYGQGVATAAACDTSLVVSPTNSFNGTAFKLDSITVLDSVTVNTASAGLSNCVGKVIALKVLNSSNVSLFACDITITAVTSGVVTPTAGTCVNGGTPVAASGTASNKGFTIGYTGGSAILAADVAKITLESRN